LRRVRQPGTAENFLQSINCTWCSSWGRNLTTMSHRRAKQPQWSRAPRSWHHN